MPYLWGMGSDEDGGRMMTSHNQFRKLKYLVCNPCETPGCGERSMSYSAYCDLCMKEQEEEE